MIYLMKQKLFSWGDDFTIKTTPARTVSLSMAKPSTSAINLSFQDMAGNELAFIRQKLLSWGPNYEISKGDQLLATVTKELFTFFKCTFTVDVPGPNDLQAQGDFLDHQYVFTRNGSQVAEVSKQWFTLGDTYGVQISQGEDDVLILASTVVIDMACHGDNKR